MKKWLFLLALIFVFAVGLGGLYLWNQMQQPFYQPGLVRDGKNLSAPLDPPSQTDSQSTADETWLVEPGIAGIPEIRLRYFADGQGTPVLFVHGGPGIPTEAPLAGLQPLTDRYRFYYYDQRGCGGSTRPFERLDSSNLYQNMQLVEQKLGLGAQIADIERIRRILGQDKLILVGHSFGGFIASLYAAEFPEHVQALVLIAPAEMLVMPLDEGAGLYGEVEPLLPESMRSDYANYLQRYFDFNAIFQSSEAKLSALNAAFTPYYVAAAKAKGFDVPLGDPQATGGWMVQAMYLSMGQRHDYRAALQSVQAPVLVLHGSIDLQSEAASRVYAETFPNAEFQVIQGGSHFMFNEKPAEFARLVGEFLERAK